MKCDKYIVAAPGQNVLIPAKVISATITDNGTTIYKLIFEDMFNNEHEIYIPSEYLSTDCNPKALLASYFSGEELIDEVNIRFHIDIPYPTNYDNPN